MTIKLLKRPPDCVELQLDGRFDSTTAAEAQEGMLGLCDTYTNIIINMANLAYISSAGLRVLLSLQKRVTANSGELTVMNVNSAVQEIFEMTGFSSMLQVV